MPPYKAVRHHSFRPHLFRPYPQHRKNPNLNQECPFIICNKLKEFADQPNKDKEPYPWNPAYKTYASLKNILIDLYFMSETKRINLFPRRCIFHGLF